MTIKNVVLAIMGCLIYAACASSTDIFGPIGTHLGNPLTLAVNSTTGRLYVNNSNNLATYDSGSLQIYNITTPASPTLVGTAGTYSFSGQIYLDATNQFLYTPNRYNTTGNSTTSQLAQVNINEASSSFLGVNYVTSDLTPFGIACCDPSGRMMVPTLAGTLDAYTVVATGTPALTSYNLTFTDSTGVVYTNPAVSELAIIGTQAFVPMLTGSIAVVNMSELGGSNNPVDYVITGVAGPRGIATDGSYLYVANVDAASLPSLLVLDPYSAQTSRTDSTALAVPITNTGVTVATLTMGTGTSSTDPREVLIGTNNIFVTNLGDDSVTVVQCTTGAVAISTCVTPNATPSSSFVVNQSIAVGDQPYGMALYSPSGTDTALYVANIKANTISIINVPTLAVSATFSGP